MSRSEVSPSVGMSPVPAVVARRLDELGDRTDARSRAERHRLRRCRRAWHRDLAAALKEKSPAARKAEAERRWRVRFRTRPELEVSIADADRRLMHGQGSREELLALVACRESAHALLERLKAGRSIVSGGHEARAFRERSRLPGYFAGKDPAALVSEVEWALVRFDDADAGLRAWIARNVARELFFELRTAELETLIGIGRDDFHRVAEEAMDALLTPLPKACLTAFATLLEDTRRVADGPGNPSKRRRYRARELRLLRRLRRHSLLPLDPSKLDPRIRRERELQRTVCEAFTAWRVLCRRPGDAPLRHRLAALLEELPQFTAGWPFGAELERARAFVEMPASVRTPDAWERAS